VGSKTFDGVWFIAYTKDHLPPHVHGKYAETTVILEILRKEREVRVANRIDAIQPPNAKRSDVKKILQVAAEHAEDLIKLWEAVHGSL
jgi:hypothetical protein